MLSLITKRKETRCPDTLIVWSLNAKFEPDHDKADKSAKLCIQFPWDTSMKSEMGAQEKNFLLPYKMGNTFHHCAAVLRVLKGKVCSKSEQGFP